MSLRIWLPLTKDLRNQGLDDITVTNNGATFNSAGKLGEKYFSAGTITIPASSSNFIFNGTHMSFSFWLKPVGTSGTSAIFGQTSMSAGDNRMYSIFQYPTPNDLHISWQSETSSSTFIGFMISGFFEADKWTHCALVYDGSKLLVYKNGVLNGTYNGVNTRTAFNYDYPINASSIRCLNDFRIYDHCLSPLEVKELSKGLILHYPLNRQGWGQENLLPCGGTYTQSSPWTTTLNRTDGYAFVTNSGFEATPGKTYTISVECDGNLYSAHGGTHNPSDKHWTFWAYISNINTTANWQNGGYDTPRNLTSSNNNYRKIGNTHVWTITLTDSQKYIGLRTNSYSNGTDNVTIKWWNMKVEEGDTFTGWSPNSSSELGELMNLNSTIEYDTSGFHNNGTRKGTSRFSWTSDTPKYSVSQIFSGIHRIEAPFNPGNSPTFTVAGWFYHTGGTTYYGAKNSYNTFICLEGGRYFVYNSTGSAYVGYWTSTANTWQHVVLVHDAVTAKLKLYINGNFVSEVTTNGTIYGSDILDIGGRQGAAQYSGKMSDFRIYATALSADDVKSLYNNSAYIDNQGNIYGAVYEEV